MNRSRSGTPGVDFLDQLGSSAMSSDRSLESQDDQTFRVLALDGGGIRGVCTATYLAQLEDNAEGHLHEYFDLICGTSIGGIIALAIALEVPMSRVKDMFFKNADMVFQRKHPRRSKVCAMLRDSLYCSKKLHDTIQALLGTDSKIGDAKCRLCIPAVNITTGRVTVFKTRHAEDLIRDYKLKAWQVAAATSAAPIYFDPVSIPSYGEYVDGGLWANTPSTVGILEGLRLGKDLRKIELLSIGTGDCGFHRDAKRCHGWFKRILLGTRDGLIGWNTDLVDLPMQAQIDSEKNYMKLLLRDRHHRVQFPLQNIRSGVPLDAIDDVGKLEIIASEEAKRTVCGVRERFLYQKVRPFAPYPGKPLSSKP